MTDKERIAELEAANQKLKAEANRARKEALEALAEKSRLKLHLDVERAAHAEAKRENERREKLLHAWDREAADAGLAGSEYYNEPKAVFARYRELKHSYGEAQKRRVFIERDRAALAAALASALKPPPEQKFLAWQYGYATAMTEVSQKTGAARRNAILDAHDAEVREAALKPYRWQPIEEAHEDYGSIVLINAADPGSETLSHVCSHTWEEDSAGMTHFALVPAFERAPEPGESGKEIGGDDARFS